MNLYRISQNVADGWDTYDSAIVAAKSPEDAASIHPSTVDPWPQYGDWVSTPEQVTVELIGVAVNGTSRGVVLASFNAG